MQCPLVWPDKLSGLRLMCPTERPTQEKDQARAMAVFQTYDANHEACRMFVNHFPELRSQPHYHNCYSTSSKKLLVTRHFTASNEKLLAAPGIATSNKKLLITRASKCFIKPWHSLPTASRQLESCPAIVNSVRRSHAGCSAGEFLFQEVAEESPQMYMGEGGS